MKFFTLERSEEVNRPSVKVMADLNYFLKLDQPLEDIAKEPEFCAHVHIAEGGDGRCRDLIGIS